MMAISKQTKKDVGPHQSMIITSYSCTFQAYHFENYHKGYLNLSKEIMFSIYLEQDPALQAEEDIANKLDANYLNLS